MRSKESESAECLGRVGCLDALKPLAGAPTEGTVVIQIPPSEAISDFGAADYPKYVSFLKHLYSLMVKTGASAKAKSRSFGISYLDVVSDSDTTCSNLICGGQFDGQEQGGIQTFGTEVFFANSTKLYGCACGHIHVPLYPSPLKVLDNHAWLNSEFTYGGTKYVGAPLIQVESEEAEAEVMSRIWKVTAEPVSNQRFGYWSRARGAMAEKLPERTQMHFAWILRFGQALHSCALKVLDQMTVLFYRFRDGRAPSLKTTLRFEEG